MYRDGVILAVEQMIPIKCQHRGRLYPMSEDEYQIFEKLIQKEFQECQKVAINYLKESIDNDLIQRFSI